MIIKEKKDIAAIMREYDKLDELTACFSDDSFPADFARNKKRYQAIQETLSLQLDDLANTQEILQYSIDNSDSEGYQTGHLTKTLQTTVHNIKNFKLFSAPHQFINFYLIQGFLFYKQQRFNDAFHCWGNVLRNDPTNRKVLHQLNLIVKNSKMHWESAAVLLDKHKLTYSSSFASGYLEKPLNLLVLNDKKEILICNSGKNNICKFDINGQYLEKFSYGLNTPHSMFKDDQENIWICDFGNKRIVAINSNKELIEEIQINKVVHNKLTTCCPVNGCKIGNTIYLILKDITQTKSNIVSFHQTELHSSLCVFQLDKLQNPRFMRRYDNQIYIGETEPAGLHLLDTQKNRTERLNHFEFPSPLLGFVKDDDIFFVNAGEYLFKITKNETTFVADARSLLGSKNAILNSVDLSNNDGKKTIFMLDASQFCVHTFNV